MLEAAGVAAAVAAAVLGVGKVAHATWRIWRRVDVFLDDWNGVPERPGFTGLPSMSARVSSVESALIELRAQVTPNGGTTQQLGDRIVRMEARLERMEARLEGGCGCQGKAAEAAPETPAE